MFVTLLHFCLIAVIVIIIIIIIEAFALEHSLDAVIVWVRQMVSQFGSGGTCGRMTHRPVGLTGPLCVTQPFVWALPQQPGCVKADMKRWFRGKLEEIQRKRGNGNKG